MDFLSGENERKCIGDSSTIFCKKKHYMKKIEENVIILNTSEFFGVVRHHKELVRVRCNWVCPREILCSMQIELEKLNNYAKYIIEKNLNERVIVNKIGFIYEKEEAQERKVFSWREIIEWKTEQCPENTSLIWRSQFL